MCEMPLRVRGDAESISAKVGVDKRLEKHGEKGGSQRHDTFMGGSIALWSVCQWCLSTRMNVDLAL